MLCQHLKLFYASFNFVEIHVPSLSKIVKIIIGQEIKFSNFIFHFKPKECKILDTYIELCNYT